MEIGSRGEFSCLSTSSATSTTATSVCALSVNQVFSSPLSSRLENGKQLRRRALNDLDIHLKFATSKRIKRGFKAVREPVACGVIFESTPTWLWALRLSEFTKLVITQDCERILRTTYASTWDHIASKMVIIKHAQIDTTSVDIWFVSGSRRFVEALGMQESTTAVAIWLYPTGRSKPSNSRFTTWVRVAHSQVGGVTNVTGMFGTQNVAPFIVEVDPIARTIAHIIKHSERPVP